jgi:HPt (histidine-containing phosphotransfer) domain-containing protein
MNAPPPPVLDLATALAAMGDEREIFEEVLEVYLKSTPELIRELGTAVKSGDRSIVCRYAHTLKSSSRAVGGMRLGAAAESLEQAAAVAGDTDIERQASHFSVLFADLTAELGKAGFTLC